MRIFVSLIILVSFGSINAQVTGLSGWNIFLDPGHSQKENMGIYNYSEAERNLRVALRLRDVLMATTDIDTVYLSRTNDLQSVSLSQRTDKANSLGADWFHSIHSNAGAPGSNSTLLLWGQYYNGNEKVPNGGQAMADIMVDLLSKGMRIGTSGSIGDCSFYTWSNWCKTSGGPYLHVNRTTSMPSELSESGFHTNPRQNQLFMNADWKKLEAMTFYWSILEYHGIQRPDVGIVTGTISDKETGIPINGAKVTLNNQVYVTDTYETLFNKYSNDPEQLHNGFYYFDSLPNDTLELIVEHENYYSDTVSVFIQDDFFTFKDIALISSVPPKIISTIPQQGFQKFPAWENIILKFSRKLNKVSVETTLVTIPELTGNFRWTDNYRELIFRPDNMLFDTEYQLIISGQATDNYGHLFDGNGDGIGGDDFILNFKSGNEDLVAPEIADIYPPQTSNEIELFPVLNLVYDEPIDTTSIPEKFFQLERFKDHSYVSGELKHYYVGKNSIFSFFPDSQLFPDEIYVTRINAGIQDLFGNPTQVNKSYSFKTSSQYFNVTLIEDFDSGLSNWLVPQQSGSTTGILTDSTSSLDDSEFLNLLTNSTNSMQLKYGWDQESNSWLLREYLNSGAPKNVTFDKNYVMQMYVFGDGSNVQLRFAVDDNYPAVNAQNHEVSPWFTVDWLGWRLVEWDMLNDGTGTWSPLGDGNLDGTLRFDSIQLTHTPGNPLTGTLYFDDLRLVKKIEVNVEEQISSIPANYSLHQNFPNPFNPTTTIKFSLPKKSIVTLKLFDMMGNELQTLVKREFTAGTHSVVLNAEKLASGMYLYRLEADHFNDTKKLILLQ